MYIALDLETTGFDHEKDKIIEIAAIKCDEKTIYKSFSTLVNPKIPIPKIVEDLTGINNHEVAQAPLFEEVKDDLRQFIGDMTIIGHFVSFDTKFLKSSGIDLKNNELDTCELARALLPFESSYSLEVLGEKYTLTHHNKHRAFDDAKASIELLHLLIKIASDLPESVKENIRKLLARSSWSWKEILQKTLDNKNAQRLIQPPEYNIAHDYEENIAFQETIAEKLKYPATEVIECPSYTATDILKAVETYITPQKVGKEKKQIIIVWKHLDTLEPHLQKTKLQTAIIKKTENYLCKNRLKRFVEEKTAISLLNNDETSLLVKIAIWEYCTKTGEKYELKLRGEEEKLWRQICSIKETCMPRENKVDEKCTEKDCFFTKALTALQKADVIFTDHEWFLKNSASGKTLLPANTPVIIDEAITLENSLKQIFRTKLTQEINGKEINSKFQEKIDIFWAVIGMILNKYNNLSSSQAKYIILDKEIAQTNEGYNLKQTLNHILSLEKTDCHDDLEKIYEALLAPERFFIQIYEDKEGKLHITCLEINLGNIVKKYLWAKYPHILLIVPYAKTPPENTPYKFILQLLNVLPSTKITTIKKTVEHPEIVLMEDTIPLGKTGYFKQLADYIQIMAENLDHVFFVHTGKSGIGALHRELASALKNKGKSLLSQEVSGGTGKIAHITHHNSDKVVLLGKPMFLEELISHKEFPLLNIKHLCIIALPFDAPTDEWHKKQAELIAKHTYGNGAENDLFEIKPVSFNEEFNTYTLPQTCLKLQHILNLFCRYEINPQTITILDSRLVTTGYGKSLQDILKKDYTLNILTEEKSLEYLGIKKTQLV